jgi:Fe-S-cluster containining protein
MSQFLLNLYRELDKKVERFNLPCAKGCGDCCEVTPDITFLEWKLIEKFLKERQVKKINNYACPFLIDHACFIYPVRPIICRLYGWSYIISHSTHMRDFLVCEKISIENPKNFIALIPYWEKITRRSFRFSKELPRPINEFLKTA